MNILERIVLDKKKEVALKKNIVSVSELKNRALFKANQISLSKNLKENHNGIIAEHKRRSPSKMVINQKCNVQDIVKGYTKAGVSGISVLTDGKYFGGSLDDLLLARASTQLPILRKDFIIDSYQIIEAKAYGANVVLLIASYLNSQEMQFFNHLAKDMGLETLIEIHNQEELDKIKGIDADIIGINNRNLKTFEVSLKTSAILSNNINKEQLLISESGIYQPEDIRYLKPFGFKGFLIGENFMKTENPGETCKKFMKSIIPK